MRTSITAHLAVALLLSGTQAWAQGSGGTRDKVARAASDDSLLAEVQSIKDFIKHDLRDYALTFLKDLKLDEEQPEGFRSTLKDWVANEKLVEIIPELKFDTDDTCLAGTDQNMSASTDICKEGEKRILGSARICLDAYKYATEYAQPRRMLAELFHEIGHQLCLDESVVGKAGLEAQIGRYLLNQQRAMIPGGLKDWEPADDSELMATIEIGTVFKVTQDFSAYERRMIYMQDGHIYPDLSGLRPGLVYCEMPTAYFPGNGLKKNSKLKVTEREGIWGTNSGNVTRRSLRLGTVEIMCTRYPDRGPEISMREFVSAVRGFLRYEGHSKVKNTVNSAVSFGGRLFHPGRQ